MSDKLSALDTIHVTAVLEDCVDQLAILGSILPVSADNQRGHQVRNLCFIFAQILPVWMVLAMQKDPNDKDSELESFVCRLLLAA